MKNRSSSARQDSLLVSSPLGSFLRSASASARSALIRRALVPALCFLFSLAVSGVEVFPGTYPLGLAALSSSSGLLPTLSALLGSVIASARISDIRGVYLLVYIFLFILRCGVSVWLSSDRHAHDDKGKTSLSSLGEKLKGLSVSEIFGFFEKKTASVCRENIRVRLAVSAVGALFAGAWSVIGGGYIYYDLFGALFSLITVPLFTYLFYAAFSRNMRASRVRETGIYFVCAAVALSLHSLSALPLPSDSALSDMGIVNHGLTFDFGALAAFAASVLVSLGYGVHRGALCGLICGAVLSPVYAPAYALAGVTCGLIESLSPSFAVLFGGTAACVWAIYVGGFDGMALIFPPVVVACALIVPAYRFGLIRFPPELFVPSATERRRADSLAVTAITANDMRRRVDALSDGLCSVSKVLYGLSDRLSRPDRSDMREICESVFTYRCATCKNRSHCSEAAAARIDPATPLVSEMVDSLMRFGAVTADSVPPSLASECYNISGIIDDINRTASAKADTSGGDSLTVTADDCLLAGTLIGCASKNADSLGTVDGDMTERLAKLISREDFSASSVCAYGGRVRRIFVDDVDVNSSVMGAEDIRTMFADAAGCALSVPEFRLDGEVLSMELHSLPRYTAESGIFSLSSGDGEIDTDTANDCEQCGGIPAEVCGDVIRTFETDGIFYVILSDGMGTGREAAMTSGITVSLLSRLISSGADLECALKMLNRIIRSAGRECSATVDIAAIDLMTGEARFVKSGAAPSFVIRDGAVFRLQSKTVPIGIIRALDAEMLKFDVQAGDTVVMLSDGAARSYEEVPWLLDMMAHDEEISRGDRKKAAEKIVREARRRGSRDDITAGVIRIN